MFYQAPSTLNRYREVYCIIILSNPSAATYFFLRPWYCISHKTFRRISLQTIMSMLLWYFPVINRCLTVNDYGMSHLMTKPTKWHARPAKTPISLDICPVWSETLLSAGRKLGSLATYWAHSEDTDQTGRSAQSDLILRWAHSYFVGFVMRRLICNLR